MQLFQLVLVGEDLIQELFNFYDLFQTLVLQLPIIMFNLLQTARIVAFTRLDNGILEYHIFVNALAYVLR